MINLIFSTGKYSWIYLYSLFVFAWFPHSTHIQCIIFKSCQNETNKRQSNWIFNKYLFNTLTLVSRALNYYCQRANSNIVVVSYCLETTTGKKQSKVEHSHCWPGLRYCWTHGLSATQTLFELILIPREITKIPKYCPNELTLANHTSYNNQQKNIPKKISHIILDD